MVENALWKNKVGPEVESSSSLKALMLSMVVRKGLPEMVAHK
jgi:hypothetical protein